MHKRESQILLIFVHKIYLRIYYLFLPLCFQFHNYRQIIVYSFIEFQNACVIQTKRIRKNGEAFSAFIAIRIEDDGIERHSHYC